MSYFIKILVCPVPEKVGIKIPLAEGDNLVGRASPPCEIQLEGGKVSKKHCVFRVEGSKLTLLDLNSANGLFVNGKRVENSELHDKDRVVVGDFILEVTVKK
ncbi:MAG: FHA domain-containing protein [Bdellovibrionota bacterium]